MKGPVENGDVLIAQKVKGQESIFVTEQGIEPEFQQLQSKFRFNAG